MRFKVERDNVNLITRLENIVKGNRVSHAYIFEGPQAVDKKDFAQSLTKGILCNNSLGENCGQCNICSKIDSLNHEDVIYVKKDGNSVKDEAVIKMQERLKTKPLGQRHVVIIEDSDYMTDRAQNRLLKTLEEPPGSTVIILLCENMEKLVQTIQSRCVKYRINYFGTDSYDFMLDKAERIAKMALERQPFYKLKKETDSIVKSREDTLALLDSLEVIYRNMLVNRTGKISLFKNDEIIDNIKAVENARRQVVKDLSKDYAIRKLLLKIGG